jgi:carbon monoxide dehydrogenase subunit G
MSRTLLLAVLLLVPSAFAAAQTTPVLPTITDAERPDLEAGEIRVRVSVDGQTINGRVTAVIDADPESVWSVVSDFVGQERWVPDFQNARIVSGSGARFVAEAETDLPWPLTTRTWQVALHNREATVGGEECYVSSWTYVEGSGNMVDQTGFWIVTQYEDDPQRTLVHYRFRADAGISAPDFIERNTTRSLLPEIVEGLREVVN